MVYFFVRKAEKYHVWFFGGQALANDSQSSNCSTSGTRTFSQVIQHSRNKAIAELYVQNRTVCNLTLQVIHRCNQLFPPTLPSPAQLKSQDPSKDAWRKVHNPRLQNNLANLLHKRQMRGVLADVVVTILRALKLDDENVRDAALISLGAVVQPADDGLDVGFV